MRFDGTWIESLYGMERFFDVRFPVSAITFKPSIFEGTFEGNVMFVRLKQDRKAIWEIVELRGGTVVLLPIFICEGERFTVLVKQPRIATANMNLSSCLPNDRRRTFGGAAAASSRRIGCSYDETSLLTCADLHAKGMKYFSLRLLDEKARFYMVERIVTRQQLVELQGKATGLLKRENRLPFG